MPIRVLVVEDSLTVRHQLVDIISSDRDLLVAGATGDGQDAIDLCRRLRPDVVSLDMMLPRMTGVEVTEHVMAYMPTPILIVSASTNRGELLRTYDALAAGAIEVLEKGCIESREGAWGARYTQLLKLVSRIKVITHPRAKLGSRDRPPQATGPLHAALPTLSARPAVLAIGGSTGAPGAMADILRSLTPAFPLPILLVLHISPSFADALPEWFADQSGLAVTFAREGDPLPGPGQVAMAPADRHLEVHRGRLRITRDPERHSCRPSVDTLFESVARQFGGASVACLLTGMGRDGAEGLLAIHRAGGFTIAQDEATSVVFGMPKEAILLGAAARVVPLGEIGPTVAAVVEAQGSRP